MGGKILLTFQNEYKGKSTQCDLSEANHLRKNENIHTKIAAQTQEELSGLERI